VIDRERPWWREIAGVALGTWVDSWRSAWQPSGRWTEQRYPVAAGYDLCTAFGQPYRDRAVKTLAPAAGSVVLDVGCGTGLNFAGLQEAIGPRGRLIGIDRSSQMLAGARERVQRHGWDNVTLLEGAVEDVAVPVLADAALLCAVHDILRSPAGLANVLGHVRPGGRVVAVGAKWVPYWRPESLLINPYTWLANRDYVTTFDGFDAPWSHLARLVAEPSIDEELCFGAGFLAVGTRPGLARRPWHPPSRHRRASSTARARGKRELRGLPPLRAVK
jgi:demethylmenaquinone methyltransferase/2-methoxy-6-polyprenyl-1,4-benzoquinol methylase